MVRHKEAYWLYLILLMVLSKEVKEYEQHS